MTVHHEAASMAQVPVWDDIPDAPQSIESDGLWYLSGPMSGYQGHNYEVFARGKHELESRGFRIDSPADHGYVDGWSWFDYIIRDLHVLKGCSGIIVLPYFWTSPGACIEVIACRRNNYPLYRLDGAQFVGQLRNDGALDYEQDDMDIVLAHGEPTS